METPKKCSEFSSYWRCNISLRDEAKQKDISTNTLLNQIVKEHLKWHANASNAGFIAVRRLLITNLINYLSEQEIISVAENVAKNANKDTILLLENEYTMKSALDFIEEWIKISGYKYRHHETTIMMTIQLANSKNLLQRVCNIAVYLIQPRFIII